MRRLNKPTSVHVYPDANHGFANPSGQAYNAVAAEDAWQRTLAFLQENLASEQQL
jgi:carboxymethylenebutenolidase